MRRKSVFFTEPRHIGIKAEEFDGPRSDEVLVQTVASAISAGTELLFYRGQLEQGMIVDREIPVLKKSLQYPLKYGYAAVGKIVGRGDEIPSEWDGRLVFSFHPHESHFCARLSDLIIIPPSIKIEDALFLPSVETAISLTMDGEPACGENICVIGQGIVGLLTTSLLGRVPLTSLVTVDKIEKRRSTSLQLGANFAFDANTTASDLVQMAGWDGCKADLTFELSGNPEALQLALDVTGFEGRIVVGSWYGGKAAPLHLGGDFHRNRLKMISSQVSSIGPRFHGRWNKERRYNLAWKMIERLKPSRFITHRFDISEAAEAYDLLDKQSSEVLQMVLTYGGT